MSTEQQSRYTRKTVPHKSRQSHACEARAASAHARTHARTHSRLPRSERGSVVLQRNSKGRGGVGWPSPPHLVLAPLVVHARARDHTAAELACPRAGPPPACSTIAPLSWKHARGGFHTPGPRNACSLLTAAPPHPARPPRRRHGVTAAATESPPPPAARCSQSLARHTCPPWSTRPPSCPPAFSCGAGSRARVACGTRRRIGRWTSPVRRKAAAHASRRSLSGRRPSRTPRS